MGILLSWPERVIRVRIYVIKDLRDEALNLLYKFKDIHVEEVKIPKAVRPKLDENTKIISNARTIINNFLQHLSEKKEVGVNYVIEPSMFLKTIKELTEKLKPVVNTLNNLTSLINTYKERLKNVKYLLKYLKPLSYEVKDFRYEELCFEGNFLSIKTWVIPIEKYESIKPKLIRMASIIKEKIVNNEVVIIVASVKPQDAEVENLLMRADAKYLNIPKFKGFLKDFITKLEEDVNKLSTLIKTYETERNSYITKYLNDAALLKILCDIEEERIGVLLKALETNYISALEGWVPISELNNLKNMVLTKIKYALIDEVKVKKEEPPTKMSNPKPVKPFEVITKLYGVPKYDEWDPTPIMAYSFIIFFGFMFADVVYGSLLMIVSKYILPKLVDDPTSEAFKKFQKVLYMGGISTIFFGFLSGSYMGDFLTLYLNINPPVFVNILSPVTAFVISLLIGLTHLIIAHILAAIKGLLRRDKALFLNEVGILVAVLAGTPYIIRTLLHYPIPLIPEWFYSYLLYIALGGVALIFISKFIAFRFFAILTWIFDVTGFLGDVLSYTRLAGVGLATYYLSTSFNAITKALIDYLISSVPVAIAGFIAALLIGGALVFLTHVMNLALGALGAFIHSLRLCFVEFISKFYEGVGKEFTALTYTVRARVTLSLSSF